MIRLLLCIFIVNTSCTTDRNKAVDRDKFTFSTGDDTEIFFRNMRASYYQKEERKENRLEIYRHEDLFSDSSGYALNVAIVINGLRDEAYILLEPGDKIAEQEVIVVFWENKEDRRGGKIILEEKNIIAMQEFASQLFEAIREEKLLFIKTDNDIIPILQEPERREAFRITMADYFRLVRVF